MTTTTKIALSGYAQVIQTSGAGMISQTIRRRMNRRKGFEFSAAPIRCDG